MIANNAMTIAVAKFLGVPERGTRESIAILMTKVDVQCLLAGEFGRDGTMLPALRAIASRERKTVINIQLRTNLWRGVKK